MITETMIKAAALGGITTLWSYITLKTMKICKQIIFYPKEIHCPDVNIAEYIFLATITHRDGF